MFQSITRAPEKKVDTPIMDKLKPMAGTPLYIPSGYQTAGCTPTHLALANGMRKTVSPTVITHNYQMYGSL